MNYQKHLTVFNKKNQSINFFYLKTYMLLKAIQLMFKHILNEKYALQYLLSM